LKERKLKEEEADAATKKNMMLVSKVIAYS